MSLEKLVYMANQIGRFFNSQGQEQAVAGTTDHIRKFWDPHMRETIAAHLEAGGAGLDPVARLAVERLKDAQKKKPEKPGVE
jgi:formate dehydrogenase subunit delta